MLVINIKTDVGVVLLSIVVVTGVIMCVDKVVWKKKRHDMIGIWVVNQIALAR